MPPSVSNVSVKTSVVTTSRSLLAADRVEGAPPGTEAGETVGRAPVGSAEGTATVEEPGTVGATLVDEALTVGVDEGKKVALWPLKTCH